MLNSLIPNLYPLNNYLQSRNFFYSNETVTFLLDSSFSCLTSKICLSKCQSFTKASQESFDIEECALIRIDNYVPFKTYPFCNNGVYKIESDKLFPWSFVKSFRDYEIFIFTKPWHIFFRWKYYFSGLFKILFLISFIFP